MSRPWIEFIAHPGARKVQCSRCGKLIKPQRMARGAHAAWCLRQPSNSTATPVGGNTLSASVRDRTTQLATALDAGNPHNSEEQRK